MIWTATARRGANLLPSEDRQDGFTVGDMRVLNSFKPENRAELDALLR